MDLAIVEGHVASTRKTVETFDDLTCPPVAVRRLHVVALEQGAGLR